MDPNTPRSSITVVDHSSNNGRSAPSPLEREISRDEKEFEEYGGNDIHDPRPKSPALSDSDSSHHEEKADPNLVTWEGPNDPANPQNWSTRYKWWVTIVCSIITVNVYV
jgi:MFS transporter, DHA1 family, multidrug resistance protein